MNSSGFQEDRDRQVVPRWRSFAAAAAFRELSSLKVQPANTFSADMLSDELDDWRRQPGISVASDIVSSALTIGQTKAVRDIAEYVIAHKNATAAARDIAAQCLEDPSVRPNQRLIRDYGPPESSPLALRAAIHQSRKRLAVYPTNPVLWTNLALFFTTLGQQRKARDAMRVAVGLAPDNRFVIRAACRFFLHQGDIEQAHDVLLRTKSVERDPWILAGEIAVSAIRGTSSHLGKRAAQMMDSQNYSPFHLSELSGALATVAANDGNMRKARKLCRITLAEPAENALAQFAWLRRNRDLTIESPTTIVMQSSEANAWTATVAGNWSTALEEAKQWQAEQPFSSRPALLAGYIAAVVLDNFTLAEEIIGQGLVCNQDDALLYNNMAFATAKQNKLKEARVNLIKGQAVKVNPQQQTCLTATQGLIEFRAGNIELGRLLYKQAMQYAGNDKQLSELALIYYAIEEIRIGSADSEAIRRDALRAADSFNDPRRKVFRKKVENAQFDPEAKKSPNHSNSIRLLQ